IASSSPATASASPGTSGTKERPHEDPRGHQAGARHGDAGEDVHRPAGDRHHGHHLDRVAVRRVRGRGGPAHQGEARPGRGRRGWPCASWSMGETVDGDGKTLRAARQVEGGLEVFDLPLPAILTAQKGLNEPRYPTLKGIMGAKKKEIRDVKAADLGWAPEPP